MTSNGEALDVAERNDSGVGIVVDIGVDRIVGPGLKKEEPALSFFGVFGCCFVELFIRGTPMVDAPGFLERASRTLSLSSVLPPSAPE